MANKIRVKRGTETARTSNSKDQYEIHYSYDNSGNGREERLWVQDSTATGADGSSDVLVGPFEFVEGPSGLISVNADYTTGRVTIDYREPSTYNPTMGATFRATNYSNNAVVEAYDSFNGTSGHTLTITAGTAATELPVDWGYYTYNPVGNSPEIGGNFPSPINAQDDGSDLSSGSSSATLPAASYSFPMPATFSITSPSTRRQQVVVNARTSTANGNLLDTQTFNANFGWRVRGFMSTQLFTSSNLPTEAQITSGSEFHYISQTPTSATNHNTTKFDVPAGASAYHLYLIHTCGQDNVGTPDGDNFGWIPSLVETNSSGVVTGAITPLEVTDYAGNEVFIGSIGGTSGTALGNQNDKAYRIWRLTASPVPGGETIYTIIS